MFISAALSLHYHPPGFQLVLPEKRNTAMKSIQNLASSHSVLMIMASLAPLPRSPAQSWQAIFVPTKARW